MMFRKNKMLLNIVIDFVMLTAMALVSISGFILEIVIPSRHAVKFQGATPWSSQLLGLEGMIGANSFVGRNCVGHSACYSYFITHKHGIGFY